MQHALLDLPHQHGFTPHSWILRLDLPFPDVMIFICFRTVNTTLKCNFVIILHHIILGHLHSTGLIFRLFSQLHLHLFHATINHPQSRKFINRRLRIYIQSYLIGYTSSLLDIAFASRQYWRQWSGTLSISRSNVHHRLQLQIVPEHFGQ